MKQLTKKEKAKYIKGDGNKCPKCGSSDIVGDSVEIDAGGAWQSVSCSECEAEWVDIYKLTDVEME
jgi:transcription elongation factor Elf1